MNIYENTDLVFVARNSEVYFNIAATCWSSNVWLFICIANQGYWCDALLKMTGPYEKQTEMMLDSRPDHWIVSKPCRSALNGTRGVSAISSQRTMIGTGLLPQSGKGHIYCNWMYSVCLVHHLMQYVALNNVNVSDSVHMIQMMYTHITI